MADQGPAASPEPGPASAPAAAQARPRRRWALRSTLFGIVAVVAAIGAGVLFLASEAGLRFVVAEVVAASRGRLTAEGIEGSLLGTIRVHRIAWSGPEATLVATEVAIEWSPLALWSSHVFIRGLGAQRIAIEMTPSTGPGTPPESLALPLEVSIDGVAVGELAWTIGTQHGHLSGLAFGYTGGAQRHAIRSLRFAHDLGTLTGDVTFAATGPFALAGDATFAGDGALAGVAATAKFGGTLPAITVSADGSLRAARIALEDLDLAAFAAGVPQTSFTAKVDLTAPADALAGTVTFENRVEGPIDESRLPVSAGNARFHRDGDTLVLDELRLELARGGVATGRGTVVIAGAGAGGTALELALARIDLARVHSALVPTQLGGRLALQVDGDAQRAEGRLADGDLAVDFAARIANGRLDLDRFRASAGRGTLNGSGRLEFAGNRAFAFAGAAAAFDPSRFGAYPKGTLGGRLEVRGVLAPAWQVDGSITLADGSRLLGVPVRGHARGTVTSTRIAGIDADLTAGRNRIVLRGDAGAPADRLAWQVDADALAELAPLLPAGTPPLAGAVTARGMLAGLPGLPGGAVDATATGLKVGELSIGRLVVKASAAAPSEGIAPSGRALGLAVDATRVVHGAGSAHDVRVAGTGTLAAHRLTAEVTGGDVDAKLELAGGIDPAGAPGTGAGAIWRGVLRSFENRGTWPLTLATPATLEVARGHVALGAARVEGREGRLDLTDFRWDQGRVASHGSFTAVPVAGLAATMGMQFPLHSTLRLGGQWSLEASPKLNGTLRIQRERGDLYAVEHDAAAREDVALGLSEFVIDGRFTDDALAATARWRATRAGDGDIAATVGATAAGPFSRDAPAAVTVRARMPSLAPIQPWLGTSAVLAGNLRVDLAGRGTLANLPLAGTIDGDALRLDVPNWGVHLTGGRLAGRVTDGLLTLDELSLQGGDGRFVAAGVIGRVPRPDGAEESATRLTWKAQRFRLFNRPDLKLVLDGSGTVAVADGKVRLAGSVTVESGHIEYASTPDGRLADDVIVKGWPERPPSVREAGFGDTPLALDLEIDLGKALTFNGEGLETELAGRVKVSTNPRGALHAKGTIRAVRGTYFAYGQKLVIDRGRLIFDGPLDNPALDIVAVRRTPQVDAGVQLQGTVRAPQLTLTSNPPLPDGEKLSYLLTGQGLDRASRADAAALQAASAALFGRAQRPVTTTVARSLGLDDISFGSGSGSTADGSPTQVVSFGKRLTDRLSLVYEQGLTVATNGLRVEYALSRTMTLRAEAGTVSGVGIYYRRTMR